MKCFVKHDDGVYNYFLHDQYRLENIYIYTYFLDAHRWPIDEDNDIKSSIWRHKLIIYVPKEISHSKAMLYVAGGYNINAKGQEEFYSPKELLDFKNIATSNKAVVVVLEDIPNQHLLIDSALKKEDQILAFTYKKVIENPMKNAYLAGHLPMVKSIIKGMDASQEILANQNINISDFVLVGLSKRGWAAWLASLEDSRVSAIVPVVIDILNVQKNISHICSSYKNYCPPALKDYQAEGVTNYINTDAFTKLMQIEDPYSYLSLPSYVKQTAIPKYIINTSGDDFYAPDSSKFYFKNLKGNNHIRYLPNAMHYFKGNIISDYLNNIKFLNDAVNNYFYFQLNNSNLPYVSWDVSHNKMNIFSSLKPVKAKLWSAHNSKERDFRFLNSYSKFHLGVKSVWIYLSKYLPFTKRLCDNCYQEQDIVYNCALNEPCNIKVNLPIAEEGWQASFVELFYNIGGKEFIITTEVNISPDTYPDNNNSK